jgi:D-erythronate 2-dehydrogenase
MRVLVTGAAGFVGRCLARALAEWPGVSRLVLTDRDCSELVVPGADIAAGDLCDNAFLEGLTEPGFDLVFHLASVPGALAESDSELGYKANLQVPMELARQASARRRGARFVFASSIAVYGDLAGMAATEDTPPAPTLSYGAHKRMTEIFLADLRRRGDLSAISLRLPGIVARSPAESGHGSAFMSLIFHRIAASQPYRCPVPATASCWWMSRPAAISALLHAAAFGEPCPEVIQPPVLHASIGDVAAAVEQLTGGRAMIEWGDDQTLTRLFGAMPPLDATRSSSLGFRADEDVHALAKAALSGDFP